MGVFPFAKGPDRYQEGRNLAAKTARISAHYWRNTMYHKTQHHRYITGLDGLRAFAVLAVIAYHLNFN